MIPKTRVIRHSLRVTNRSSRSRRFAVQVVPPRVGEFEGNSLKQVSTRLEGPGKLTPRSYTVGDLPACSSARLRSHSSALYAYGFGLRIPARSSTTIVATFRRIVRPSRFTDLRVRWRVRGRGRALILRSSRPRIAGRPSVGVAFSTSPPTLRRGENGPDNPIGANDTLTISGRTGFPEYALHLFYASRDQGSVLHPISSLRSDSRGRFVYRWDPPLPRGDLEIWAETPSTGRAAGDFACSRFGTVVGP